MKRPWQIWSVFVFCVAVLFAAMGWVTSNLLRLERANAEAQRRTAVEEIVRLALWRMDAAASPLIFAESARPYFDYTAFNPAGEVFPNSVNDAIGNDLIPSPLLTHASSNVMIYFNGAISAGNTRAGLTSPQVPPDELTNWVDNNYSAMRGQFISNRGNLDFFGDNISVPDIHAALGTASSMEQIQRIALRPAVRPAGNDNETPAQIAMAGPPNKNPPAQQMNQSDWPSQPAAQMEQQQARNAQEFQARYGQTAKAQGKILGSKQDLYNFQKIGKPTDQKTPQPGVAQRREPSGPAARTNIIETVMRPLWIRDFLILARRVKIAETNYIQGAWLNWQNIRADLLSEIADLLPDADLVPVRDPNSAPKSRMMAALPVQLVPGEPSGLLPVVASPLRIPLLLAWGAVLLAALAVALLLVGAVSLSERRGAFVSAVTHELRTPLTTFRMYSEMLAEDMVKDETKRKSYLRTLCSEGNRLSHLVENVLSYARLERGRARKHVETLPLRGMIDRVRDRLAQHAERCGMTLVADETDGWADVEVTGDMSAVDQILFNLVDNACKYAASADDKRIHLEAHAAFGKVLIRVRDHGPGITRQDARRLFKPFRKSAKHAAESAPGVGLGLALSRKLARQMGGELAIDPSVTGGACLVLTIPARG